MKTMKKIKQTRVTLKIMTVLIACVALSAAASDAPVEKPAPKPAIELGAPFGDNAVLQRQMKPIETIIRSIYVVTRFGKTLLQIFRSFYFVLYNQNAHILR